MSNTSQNQADWFTFYLDQGEVKLDQIDLTAQEAQERADKLCRARLDAYAVMPPEDADCLDDGPFAVIQLIGSHALVRCSGLRHRDAKETADYSLANYGPGKAKRNERVVENADGSRTRTVSIPPVIREAYVVNLVFEKFRILYPA